MDYSGQGADHGPVLPVYVSYLSLLFKLVATTVNLLLASWVVYTIKATRSLHKSHNIYLANLLVSGVIFIGIGSLVACSIMISYQLGVESPVSCFPMKTRVLPFLVYNLSFVLIAGDKVIAITCPFKHKRIMTSRVVAAVVGGVWLISLIPTVHVFLDDVDGVTEVPELGSCLFEVNSFAETTLLIFLPMTLSSSLAISLNIYLAIKAYQVHKQIEKETMLSGYNSQSTTIKAFKKKQRNIRRNRKPLITLLVVTSGRIVIVLFLVPFLVLNRFLNSQGYQGLLNHVIFSNNELVGLFFDVLVYGLYFKQIRKPMINYLKRCLKINKQNSVAPI